MLAAPLAFESPHSVISEYSLVLVSLATIRSKVQRFILALILPSFLPLTTILPEVMRCNMSIPAVLTSL